MKLETKIIKLTDSTPLWWLFTLWLGGNVAMGFVYFFATKYSGLHVLASQNIPLADNFAGFLDSIYFSFTAASTLGFGDIVPFGNLRLLSVIQSCMSLILITLIISRVVSQKQEIMLQKIYHSSFEEKLHSLRASIYHFRENVEKINAKIEKKQMSKKETEEQITLQLLSFYTHSSELQELLDSRDQLKELEGEKMMIHFSLSIQAIIHCIKTAQDHDIDFKDSEDFILGTRLIRKNLIRICNVIEDKHYQESLIKFVKNVRSKINELEDILDDITEEPVH
jgi:hypothetical protein